MANNAINHTARVEERNGQFRYSVQFVPMQKRIWWQDLYWTSLQFLCL
ncbi:hypothetical protein HMPREF0628_1332 [Peptoniphilus lacrimalis 315-B]|uniref:Uncharacterized protein n=2 Tax=Peptoniphilus lacrimalis TaxID=33031 RepID=D1VSL8_9FIRM|nr:hypothetical protein HMPREF0628_1332 [Peptoniphilus lacrimalis 315-B]